LEIRKANVEDCSELTKLRIEMRIEKENISISESQQQKFYDNTYNYFIDNIKSGVFIAFLAVDTDEIVATSGICFYSVPPTYNNMRGVVAYVMNMYTKPQYRKKGVATQLLNHIVNESKVRNCTKITLNASEMGKSLYMKYGFKSIQNDMVYYLWQAPQMNVWAELYKNAISDNSKSDMRMLKIKQGRKSG